MKSTNMLRSLLLLFVATITLVSCQTDTQPQSLTYVPAEMADHVVPNGRIVYVTPTGSCYHEENCRTLRRSKSLCDYSVAEAQEYGYRPCKVCQKK